MPDDYHNKLDYSKFRPVGYPVRHKRKIPFQPTLSLPLEYREMLHEIRKLDSMLDGFVLGSEDYLELVKDAYSNNIHWSTKIEGNQLSLEEVKRLTTRFTRGEYIEVNNGPTQEILNHLYSFFAKRELSLPWDTNVVKNVHSILMKDVNDNIAPGVFRNEEASVVGSDGTEYFIACPPQSIEVELESLVEWLNNSPYDEIVTATIFFHEFESIHPFKDGNGRTGRTLFQILMQELGLKNCRLCKFEKEMLSDSGTYYDLLAFADSTGSYSQMIMYFTESLLKAYRDAVLVFKEKDRLSDMDENTRAIVHKIKEVKSFTFNEACTWIPGIGNQTLRSKLDKLIEMDILEKHGKTKSMRYSFKDPLRIITIE
ncbi:Fic family protein [methanogenic archaeon mixed culture ISO4-G1]|nr:Fic family protein [methanogenic archaeon mixed culture ISO4-G1]